MNANNFKWLENHFLRGSLNCYFECKFLNIFLYVELFLLYFMILGIQFSIKNISSILLL